MIIFDGGDGQHTAVVSTREERYTRSDVVPALNALLTSSDPGASVFSDGHPEELDPDLFLWLLHRHKSVGKQIGHGITITDINEMNSLDSQYRRGRYASGAGVDRVDLLALIAKGQAKLGPAKISVHDDLDPEANFDLQLFHDGGFSVFRSSRYKDHRVAAPTDNTFGHRLVEDVFESILPRIRSEYEADTQWTAEQRASFIAASKVELDVLTSD
ncbi:hypothetical protein A5N77_03235 [Prescottella equi]|nr:hypothetical protein A5N77_03235 [Prescottella equi]